MDCVVAKLHPVHPDDDRASIDSDVLFIVLIECVFGRDGLVVLNPLQTVSHSRGLL